MPIRASSPQRSTPRRSHLGPRRFPAFGLLLLLALAGAAAAVGANLAHAATATTVDCTSNPSALGSALASAGDGDTLTIQGTCKGTFAIVHSLTLSGSDGATLDGQSAGSVLTVDPGTSVVLKGLTITDGSAAFGAGILNLGAALSVSNSSISQNKGSYGAGFDNAEGGVMTLTNSTVNANSTGINSEAAGILNESFSTLTITNSTVSNNDSSQGIEAGGIFNESVATLTIASSTISGNSAFVGGGLYNNGTATIANSTITRNNAVSSSQYLGGGGIYNNGGVLTINFTTVSGNTSAGAGANIHDLAFATLENTIVSGAGSNNCSIFNGYGSIIDAGYNLDDGTSCGFSSANNSLSSVDPMLDPTGLMDNGGPTQTIALQPGSPAIDAIPSGINGCGTTITTDQRGVTRPQGPACDVGAFEVSPGADLSITKSGAPNPVVSGNRLTYRLTVSNNGPVDATGVTVTDPLPANLHFNSVSATQGSCIRSTTKPAPKDGTIVCSLGNLANGSLAKVTIVVTTTTPGTLTNKASVSGDQTDPNLNSNSATATTTVIGT